MNKYEQHWETLLMLWDNKYLEEYLQSTSNTSTLLSVEYINWGAV